MGAGVHFVEVHDEEDHPQERDGDSEEDHDQRRKLLHGQHVSFFQLEVADGRQDVSQRHGCQDTLEGRNVVK